MRDIDAQDDQVGEQGPMMDEMPSECAQPESDNGDHVQNASVSQDDDGTSIAMADNAADSTDPPSAQTALEAALRDERDKRLRLAAEFENVKKRTARERSESIKFANERILKEFLSVVDNLERALRHGKEGNEGESVVQGVELVHKQCTDLLTRFNVTPIDGVGATFDPVVHQAVSRVETGEHPDNTVADELQKGYRLYDRLLRPALVTVAVSTSAQSEEKDDTEH